MFKHPVGIKPNFFSLYIVGAPISGKIGDVVGSYDITFYIAGGFFILSSLCGFAAQVLDRHKKSKRLK